MNDMRTAKIHRYSNVTADVAISKDALWNAENRYGSQLYRYQNTLGGNLTNVITDTTISLNVPLLSLPTGTRVITPVVLQAEILLNDTANTSALQGYVWHTTTSSLSNTTAHGLYDSPSTDIVYNQITTTSQAVIKQAQDPSKPYIEPLFEFQHQFNSSTETIGKQKFQALRFTIWFTPDTVIRYNNQSNPRYNGIYMAIQANNNITGIWTYTMYYIDTMRTKPEPYTTWFLGCGIPNYYRINPRHIHCTLNTIYQCLTHPGLLTPNTLLINWTTPIAKNALERWTQNTLPPFYHQIQQRNISYDDSSEE